MLGARKFGVSWRSSSTVARARRDVPVRCPAGTQSRYQTLCVSLAAVWRHYDVGSSIEEVSKRYHHNVLFCNNNEITACIADLFDSFCEEVYAAVFFKLVQQQAIGKVENSVMCLWADNFCLQQWKNYYKNLAIANRSRVSCAHNTSRAFIGLITSEIEI